MSRTVIFHYHLFKNAGTSVDHILKDNFGERWVTREFDVKAPKVHAQEVAQWIQDNPDALAFSSHTAELPPPAIDGVTVLPLIYVRHPIDRIASAYSFEHKQGGNGFGAVLARNTTLGGYAEVRLSMVRDRQCRNFQVARFSRMFLDSPGTELEHALKAGLTLPFIGIVEDFAGSMQRMEEFLKPYFPEFRTRHVAANVSRDVNLGLADRIAALRAELGDRMFNMLENANAEDLTLYSVVTDRFFGPEVPSETSTHAPEVETAAAQPAAEEATADSDSQSAAPMDPFAAPAEDPPAPTATPAA